MKYHSAGRQWIIHLGGGVDVDKTIVLTHHTHRPSTTTPPEPGRRRETMMSAPCEDAASPPSAEHTQQGCRFCDTVLPSRAVYQARSDEYERGMDLGPFDEIASSGCRRHGPLADWLSAWFGTPGPAEARRPLHLRADAPSLSFVFRLGDAYDRETPPMDVLEARGDGEGEDEDEDDRPGYGIGLDPRWIARDTLARWYRACADGHGAACERPSYLRHLPAPALRILIDAARGCLVPAPPGAPYLALSYVWGQVDIVKTVASNLARLQVPGALEGPEAAVALPRTVGHAMALTRSLGERYLWVDSLCIVQGDEDMLNDHLGRMASIYAHARAVVVAIDGADADHGLHGLRGPPSAEPRRLRQETVPFGDRCLLRRTAMSHQSWNRSAGAAYFGRGWTFQEFLSARRRICFENDSVWFQCCRATMAEDHRRPERPFRERDFVMDLDYPSLTVFARLVEDFNQRQLRHPQDCHPAFAGLLPCFARVFTGGFLYGLPEMFLDAALLWQPGTDLVRRVPTGTGAGPGPGPGCRFAGDGLPTWSWVGWQGLVDFGGWSTGNDFVAACSGWIATPHQQTFPVTTWYTGADPGEAAGRRTTRRRIDVEWIAWRDRYGRDPDREPPPGWTRRERRAGDTLTIRTPPDGFGKYLYRRGSGPTDFWYPIPRPDETSQPGPRPRPGPQTAYLFGSVQTARLFASGAVWTYESMYLFRFESPRSACVTLRTAQQEWAGFLRLHSRDYFAARGLRPEEGPVELQLISISRGFSKHDLDVSEMEEYRDEERPRSGDRYEYYNVMCISWKEGVAFREALGRVYKPVWDSLEPSTIDVVLG